MQEEHEIREELRKTNLRYYKTSDPAFKAILKDRASTYEWVLSD